MAESAESVEAEATQCPFCKEEVKEGAVKCKHCGSQLAPSAPSHGGTCPMCKEPVHPEAVKCKHCGSMIGPTARGSGASVGLPEADCGCGGGGAYSESAALSGQFPGSRGQRQAAAVPEALLNQLGVRATPGGGLPGTAQAQRPPGRGRGIGADLGLITIDCPECEICWACRWGWCVPYPCCEPCRIIIDI